MDVTTRLVRVPCARTSHSDRSHLMKSMLWFAIGVATGFAVAHQVNRSPEGRRFFAGVDSKAREFTAAVSEGYRSREAELRSASTD
jgi:hypothetical protein